MRRTKEEAMKTRANIMESALEVFGEKNFSNASVSEITARIGLSKGAFYWHFKNKQDVQLKIVEESCTEGGEKTINVYVTASDTISSMRVYFKESIDRLKTDEHYKKVHKLMIRRHEWPEEIQKRVYEIMLKSMANEQKMIESYLANKQADGAIKKSVSPQKAASLLAGIFHGIGIMQLSGMLPEGFTESLDIFFDAMDKEFSPDGNE